MLLLILEVVALQVVAVCIWQLLTLVRRGTVFSDAAFRYVDVVIGAITAGSVVTAVIAVMLVPGETAPGVVGLICGASLVIAGVALVVYVLRMLLKQAVSARGRGRAPSLRARRGDLMPIVVDIDVMLAKRKMAVGTLADLVGISPANLSVLKNGRAKAVRFTTLEALCDALQCQPGDLLRWDPEDSPDEDAGAASGPLRDTRA